jgi:transcriptional regulator with XRE-family HTH domain
MELGDLIRQYRKNNKITLREFAKRCGTSHGYVSMLETKKNSKTGEPIVPTIEKLKAIAQAMNMSLNDLISICDDMPVSVSSDKQQNAPGKVTDLSEGELLVVELFRQLPEDSQKIYLEVLRQTLLSRRGENQR